MNEWVTLALTILAAFALLGLASVDWHKIRVDRAVRKLDAMNAAAPKLVPTNRAERRAAARKLAGRSGDKRAVYETIKRREK